MIAYRIIRYHEKWFVSIEKICYGPFDSRELALECAYKFLGVDEE